MGRGRDCVNSTVFDVVSSGCTTLVSLGLGTVFFRQYRGRGRPHALAWSISFWAIGLAALLQVVAFGTGAFGADAYRAYATLAAAVPGLMGVGSMYLLWPRQARGYAIGIAVLVGVSAVGAWAGPEYANALGRVAYASRQVTLVLTSPLLLIGFAVLGTVGAAALVLGALWSWWRSRLGFNLGIAAGGLVFSLADTLAAYGIPALFFGAEIAGVLLIYWAVQKSRAPRPVSAAAKSGVSS